MRMQSVAGGAECEDGVGGGGGELWVWEMDGTEAEAEAETGAEIEAEIEAGDHLPDHVVDLILLGPVA
jgi:hypothetical protein